VDNFPIGPVYARPQSFTANLPGFFLNLDALRGAIRASD
jgi:hypothetical protein